MDKYLKMADVFIGEYKPKRRIDAWPPSKHGETLVDISGKPAEYAVHAINSHDELVAQRNELLSALEQCRDAFEYTRQYVGYETLPPINGWSWFDADQRAKDAIAKAKGESQ